jgi:predicted extracellular nuclease
MGKAVQVTGKIMEKLNETQEKNDIEAKNKAMNAALKAIANLREIEAADRMREPWYYNYRRYNA